MRRSVPSLTQRPDAAPWPALLVALSLPLTLAALTRVPPHQRGALLQEGALVEVLTPAFYCAAILLLVPYARQVWPFMVLLAAAALREFDLDKLLFTEGLLKSRQYLGPTVPGWERLISALVLLFLLAAGGLGLQRGARGITRRIRGADGVTLCVLLGVLLLFATKIADRAVTAVGEAGGPVATDLQLHLLAFEEIGEAAAAVSFMLGAAIFVRSLARTAERAPHDLEGRIVR